MDDNTEGLAKLYTKMAVIMGNIERLPKDGTNKFQNYQFATESAIADTVRKELAGQNIAFFANLIDVVQTPKDKGFHTVATFEFTFACGDTGASITRRWIGEADDSLDKGINKASTLAMKFFLLRTFVMSTGDPSDDPDSGNPPPQKPKPAASAPRPGTQPAAPQKAAEKPAPKAEPATPAPQTPEDRRIPNGAEKAAKPKRRNLRTSEIEALKTFIKAISPEIQAEKGLTAEFHAAGSILKAMKLDDWKQLTIAEDNVDEELAAIRARIQKHVEENHVAPPDNLTRPLDLNAGDGDEPDALPKAAGL